MQTITGQMATDRPERYAKQLASHWAKRGPATEEDGATVLRWEGGQVISMLPGQTAPRRRGVRPRGGGTSIASPRWSRSTSSASGSATSWTVVWGE